MINVAQYPAPAFLTIAGCPPRLVLNHGDDTYAIYRSTESSFSWSVAHVPSGILLSDALPTAAAACRLAQRAHDVFARSELPPTPCTAKNLLSSIIRRTTIDGIVMGT